MIYLYHGTDVEFDRPDPTRGRKGTDFGQGFYLTRRFRCSRKSRYAMSEIQKDLFDIATGNLCAWVSEQEGLSIKDAMRVVYSSRLYEKLQDPETGLYREGPAYLYDMLAEERGRHR